MTDFSVESVSDGSSFGRIGLLSVRNGTVSTPALFPVINLIGGTTLDSGSSWRHFRDNILNEDHLQGIMHQAMSFLDYGLTPDQLQEWRAKTFHEHFEDRGPINAPPDMFEDNDIEMGDLGKAVRFEKNNGETETTDIELDEAHSVLQYQASWWPDQ